MIGKLKDHTHKNAVVAVSRVFLSSGVVVPVVEE